jgi:O-antigen ligase
MEKNITSLIAIILLILSLILLSGVKVSLGILFFIISMIFFYNQKQVEKFLKK